MSTISPLEQVIAAVREDADSHTTFHSTGSAELLVAEIDALRAAVRDLPNPVSVAQQFWEKRHAAVITRAMEAKP